MASRRAQREESWDSLHFSEISTETGEYDEEMDVEGTPQLRTVGDVHRALHPLQATADRVGRQVEQFAETLDRLSNRKSPNDPRSVTEIIPIVWEFEKIAVETVKRLKRHHEPDRQELLKKRWRRRFRKKADGTSSLESEEPQKEKVEGNFTTLEDLQHWEQELQTWQLLRLMLQVKDSAASRNPKLSEKEERFRRPTKPTNIHRYSSESEVWSSYLAEDDQMWERNVVIEWLKMTANTAGQEIDSIVEQLEESEDAENVLSAQGWISSKEAIKAQKRLRSWPQPLDPGSPGLEATLINSERNGLITQLDPDAPTRQERALEKDDLLFEKATWLACWEMVRRGRSWDSIREWCQERVEGWRAISMRGDPRSFYDNVPNVNNDSTTDWQTRSLWRKMCLRVAREGGNDDYERAVYGVISGDLPSVLKVTFGWDDYLFAVYNSQLLQGFDSYIQKQFPERLPKALKQDKTDFGSLVTPFKTPPEHTWQGLLTTDGTKEEAKQPMKMIQGSIIASKINDFIYNQGLNLGKGDQEGDPSLKRLIRTNPQATPAQGPSADISFKDHDILRILTHIIFIFMDLQPKISPETVIPIENIIFAYVDYLGKAGKQQLLPLYASRLSNEGSTECMARQLPFITDTSERRTVIKLMQQYHMDVAATLRLQLLLIMFGGSQIPPPTTKISAPKMLDKQNRDSHGMPSIIDNFVGDEVTSDQMDLIHGVEWYLLLDGHWQETMWAGKMVYLFFLKTGALAAARELVRRVNFTNISVSKTRYILGKSVDLSDQQYLDQFDTEQARLECEVLISKSITFQDLEGLIVALNALEDWKAIVNEQGQLQTDPRYAREWKTSLQQAHDDVCNTITPLLQNWLQQPENDTEATTLDSLRLAYLPDLTLAYIAVLTYGGHALSRDILLTVMDLAASIAASSTDNATTPADRTNTTSGLADVFVQARRMNELVDVLAKASLCMVRADEMGGRKKKASTTAGSGRKKGRLGTLGVWRVPGWAVDN